MVACRWRYGRPFQFKQCDLNTGNIDLLCAQDQQTCILSSEQCSLVHGKMRVQPLFINEGRQEHVDTVGVDTCD